MRSTDRLLDDLVEGLEPVQPIPRLRTVVALALVLGGAGSAVLLLRGGLRADLAALALRPSLAGVAIGLAAVAFGAIAASLGGAVPGRERMARLGAFALVTGLVLAAGAAGWGLVSSGVAAWEGMGLGCLATAVLIGLLPSLSLLHFLVRALPRHPAVAVATAAGGAVALGGIAVHAHCPALGGLHVLLGHALAPLLGGVLLGALLYPVLLTRRRQT